MDERERVWWRRKKDLWSERTSVGIALVRRKVPSYLFIESAGDCQRAAGVSGTGHAVVRPVQIMEPEAVRHEGTVEMTGRGHAEVGSAAARHEGMAGATGRGHAVDRPWSNDWRPVLG